MRQQHLILALSLLFAGVVSCTKTDIDNALLEQRDNLPETRTEEIVESTLPTMYSDSIMDRRIVLGLKLANPYTVANMRLAYDNLLANPETEDLELPEVTTSHYYIRFKPSTTEEYDILVQDTTLILYDHPLDYEIEEEGNYYQDPECPDSLPTYQYASIPTARWEVLRDTLSMAYDVLDDLFIPDEDHCDYSEDESNPDDSTINPMGITRSATTKDWEAINALVNEAMRITGNETDIPVTRAGSGKWRPQGRIMLFDTTFCDYVTPLKKVKVRARRWFSTYTGYTNNYGYFFCNGMVSGKVNYSIVWETDKWDIRNGSLIQARYNGPKSSNAWNFVINEGSGKTIRYATIHRAAYRYYYGDTGGLTRPANTRKEKIGYFHRAANGGQYGDYNQQWGLGVWTDIRIFGKNKEGWIELPRIFSTTCHELGHAAHYTNSTLKYIISQKSHIESWARCVQYYLTMLEYSENLLACTEHGYHSAWEFALINSAHKNGDESPIAVDGYDENGYLSIRVWYTPEDSYHFQDWRNDYRYYSMEYTPYYIDLVDNYNQYMFFKSQQQNYLLYPYDIIHAPIDLIETAVFSTCSFAEATVWLINYCNNNSETCYEYNLNSGYINLLYQKYFS